MCTYSHISMILFMFFSLFVSSLIMLIMCVSKSKKSQKSGGSTREGVSERSQKSVRSTPAASKSSKSALASDKSERALSSEKSIRKDRNTTIDSLKVPRHKSTSSDSKKSSKEKSGEPGGGGSSRGALGSETDSAKTELIEVPLGKAARDDPSNTILTPLHEQKASSFTFQSQKVQFAHTLKRVKRRGTKPDDPDEKTQYIP